MHHERAFESWHFAEQAAVEQPLHPTEHCTQAGIVALGHIAQHRVEALGQWIEARENFGRELTVGRKGIMNSPCAASNPAR
jgi:hypothetical protein